MYKIGVKFNSNFSYSRGQTIWLEIHIGLGTISLETFCPPERLPDPRTE